MKKFENNYFIGLEKRDSEENKFLYLQVRNQYGLAIKFSGVTLRLESEHF